MKTAIIYYSCTGFTEKYARMIAEAVNGDLIPFEQVKSVQLADYDAIVFGSWMHAAHLKKLKWFKKQLPLLSGKRLVVYGVGGSPLESPDVDKAMHFNFSDDEWKSMGIYYCPGGFCYERMSLSNRLLMKLFSKMVSSKKNKTPEEECAAKMMSHSYDISDSKYIQPILEYLNQ